MPRWEAQSQRGMYLGCAPLCTGSVPLVLNLQTRNRKVKVEFDDWFLTVTTHTSDLPNLNAYEWCKMLGTSIYYIPTLVDGEEFDPTYSTPIKHESDKPLFNKFIKQEIALSDPLTQPHQTYSDVVQRQDKVSSMKKSNQIDAKKHKQTKWISVSSNSPIKLPTT